MSTRTSEKRFSVPYLLVPLLLGACGPQLPDKPAEARKVRGERAIAAAEGRIECVPPGAPAYGYVCSIERTKTQDGLYLTLRHPDGGFRRLLVTNDGRGVIAADGAEPAVVRPIGSDLVEVALGEARYRLPATVRQPKAAQ